jgi:hypothetical protein
MRRLLLSAVALLALVGTAKAQTSQPTINTVPQVNTNWIQAGIESRVKTYKFSALALAGLGAAGDMLQLTGSATKTIRVAKIVVGGVATAASYYNPLILRRSTVQTGGTPTVQTPAPRDPQNSTATAVVTTFTGSPTPGTLAGTLDSCRLLLQVAGTPATPDICAFTYGINDDQMTIVRGTSDFIVINFTAAAPAGGLIDIDVEWVEEP